MKENDQVFLLKTMRQFST